MSLPVSPYSIDNNKDKWLAICLCVCFIVVKFVLLYACVSLVHQTSVAGMGTADGGCDFVLRASFMVLLQWCRIWLKALM